MRKHEARMYKFSQVDVSLAADEAAKIADRISQLETKKVKVSNEIDALETYSRINCLIVHGDSSRTASYTSIIILWYQQSG